MGNEFASPCSYLSAYFIFESTERVSSEFYIERIDQIKENVVLILRTDYTVFLSCWPKLLVFAIS
jgi:hypothetical protein